MANAWTHVIHIADLHIRTGDPERARIQEYTSVFQEFLRMIGELDCVKQGTTVTVIAGDVFHNKGRIESAGFQMFSRFLNQLSALTPVYFICGNHDFRQEDLRIPDMLDSMLDPWAGTSGNGRIHYLRDTGIYEFGNIGFGVVTVKDALAEGNTAGAVRKLPTFPSPTQFSENIQHRLALFHGAVRSSRLQNDHAIGGNGNGVSLDWFKGYDAILLGDIHKQQMGRTMESVQWGYPGSLIQQDFGESLYGHGFLLWELKKGATQCTAFHVRNPFGMLSMKKKNMETGAGNEEDSGFYVNMGNRKWASLDHCVQDARFPKTPRIRVMGCTPHMCEQLLLDYAMKPKGIIPWIGNDSDSGNEDGNDNGSGDGEADDNSDERMQRELEQLSTIASSEKWKEYIQLMAPDLMQGSVEDWFHAPETMNLPVVDGFGANLTQKLEDRRQKFLKVFHAYRESQGSIAESSRNRIVLHQIAWDYTLCYGLGNVFDFRGLSGSIALLNGRNAMGKSSFLDVLCLGLFGETAKSRIVMGKKMTAKIIHNKKPPNKRAMNIRITFAINDVNYEIVREFRVNTDKANVSQFGVELYEIVAEAPDSDVQDVQRSRKMIREGTTAVNTWIERQLGSLESILLSNFITQLDQHNFFTLKQEEQKLLLERALRLEAVSAFGDLIHEARLAHSFAVTQLGAVIEANSYQQTKQAVEAPDVLHERLVQLEAEFKIMHEQRCVWMKEIDAETEYDPKKDYETLMEESQAIVDKLGVIPEKERQQAFEQKGARAQEIKRLRECMEACSFEDMEDTQDYERALEELAQAELHFEDWEGKRPIASEYTLEMLTRMKTEIRDWEQDHQEMSADEMRAWKDRVQILQELSLSRPKKNQKTKNKTGSTTTDWLETYQENKKQWDDLLKSPRSIEKTYDDYTAWKKRYASWRKKYSDVASDPTSLEEYGRDHSELMKEMETMRKTQNEQKQLKTMVDELMEELKEYETMPFNPECWACASQPWRKIFEEKTKKLEARKKVLGDIQQKLEGFHESLKEKTERAEELVQWMDWKRKYEAERGGWESELSYWTDWKKRWNAFEEWNAAREDVSEALEEAAYHLWEELQHKQAWVTEYLRMEEMRTIVDREWDVVETWKKWHETQREMEEHVQYWKQIVQYIEWEHSLQDAEDQYQVDQKRCARIAKLEKALANVKEAKSGIAWKNVMKTQAEYDDLGKMLNNVRMAYGHAQKEYEKYKDAVETFGRQAEQWRVMQTREKTLIELEKWFLGGAATNGSENGVATEGGYKQWIYTTKVIPMIQRELNRCLGYVEPLRMRIEYEKGCFTYYVEDGERQPSLDKASGYQNFIISLCMRITLGRLGATRNDFRHLIIDEGFTSCDADNLGKMPDFLYGLLKAGDFDSILLMSHLEGIRESTQKRIDIVQEGCFSKIQFGGPYLATTYPKQEEKCDAEVPTEAPKKRGRPKKSVPSVTE